MPGARRPRAIAAAGPLPKRRNCAAKGGARSGITTRWDALGCCAPGSRSGSPRRIEWTIGVLFPGCVVAALVAARRRGASPWPMRRLDGTRGGAERRRAATRAATTPGGLHPGAARGTPRTSRAAAAPMSRVDARSPICAACGAANPVDVVQLDLEAVALRAGVVEHVEVVQVAVRGARIGGVRGEFGQGGACGDQGSEARGSACRPHGGLSSSASRGAPGSGDVRVGVGDDNSREFSPGPVSAR